jgi:hypothetical protein
MQQMALYAGLVSTEADESGADGGDRPAPPSSAQVAQGVIDLLGEVDEALSSDRWAILDSGRQHATWLLYDGAALRHCCRLLYEIEIAAAAGLELSVRMLGRAHMEAWLVAFYMHFGGYEALLKVAKDARHSLEGIELEARQFDEWLAAEKTAARKSGQKVAKTNGGIAQWNEQNPDVPPKPLLDEPYVPQLSPAGLDLSGLIDGFGPHEAQGLSLSEIVDTLTKWGPEKGFSRESFRPIYLIYRTLSAIGTHASMHILDAYFVPGGFIRVAPMPVNGSASDSVRATSLYGTAFLAQRVQGERGIPTPVADDICEWLKPDFSGRAAWAPGPMPLRARRLLTRWFGFRG